MVDRRKTDNGPWLYYKLTNEPKGSGELTIHLFVKIFLPNFNIIPHIASEELIFFSAFRLPWQHIKFSGLNKNDTADRGLHKEHSVKLLTKYL